MILLNNGKNFSNGILEYIILTVKFINFRYVKGKLPMNKPSTIGVEFATKNIELRNGQGIVKAQIWDTGKL